MATLPPPAALPPHADSPEPLLERARVVRGPDRREGPSERRRGPRDRRQGRPDQRQHPVERRTPAAGGRRSGRPDRRLGGQRRRELQAPRTVGLDPEVIFWASNVTCWAAVTAVALIWGS